MSATPTNKAIVPEIVSESVDWGLFKMSHLETWRVEYSLWKSELDGTGMIKISATSILTQDQISVVSTFGENSESRELAMHSCQLRIYAKMRLLWATNSNLKEDYGF
jgi:hypothetical protein